MLHARTPARRDVDKYTVCAGCGTESPSGVAFCPVCRKRTGEEFYPLDAIRSSHNLQGRSLPLAGSDDRAEVLFPRTGNGISDTAWACTVYSMVPYLGILFVPAALAIGGFGYITSRRTPDTGARRAALNSVGVSLMLLVVQIIFWRLLYLIPEIGI